MIDAVRKTQARSDILSSYEDAVKTYEFVSSEIIPSVNLTTWNLDTLYSPS